MDEGVPRRRATHAERKSRPGWRRSRRRKIALELLAHRGAQAPLDGLLRPGRRRRPGRGSGTSGSGRGPRRRGRPPGRPGVDLDVGAAGRGCRTSATRIRRRRVASPSRRCSARTATASSVPIRSSTHGIARRTARTRRGSARAREAGRRAASPAATRAAGGLLGEWRLAERVEEGVHERRRPVPSRGPDRRPGHLLVLVLDEPAQRVLERQGLPLREAGRLEARPSARARPPPPPSTRRAAAPPRAGPRRGGRAPPPPPRAPRSRGSRRGRESRDERVHVGVAREVEERLRPHLEVRDPGAAPPPGAGPSGRPPRSGCRGPDRRTSGSAWPSRPRTAGWVAAAWRPTAIRSRA